MDYIIETMGNLIHQTAFFNLTWGNYVMILVACFFIYLAIGRGYEPLLLLPISFGMLLVNLYPDIMLTVEESSNGIGGLLHYFYLLDEWAILPSLIFLGVGGDDRLRAADCQSDQLYFGSGSPVWCFLCLHCRHINGF